MAVARAAVGVVSLLVLMAPGIAHAATSSLQETFEDEAQVLGQVFAPKMLALTRIHSHAELGSRHARLMRNQCDATGRYQFYIARGDVYLFQTWRGKKEINRTMELVKGADPKTFTLLSAAYAKDEEQVYAIERFLNADGKCRYRAVPLAGADPETFRVHHKSTKFTGADGERRYWFGERR